MFMAQYIKVEYCVFGLYLLLLGGHCRLYNIAVLRNFRSREVPVLINIILLRAKILIALRTGYKYL
jgi:hypothetical protein